MRKGRPTPISLLALCNGRSNSMPFVDSKEKSYYFFCNEIDGASLLLLEIVQLCLDYN